MNGHEWRYSCPQNLLLSARRKGYDLARLSAFEHFHKHVYHCHCRPLLPPPNILRDLNPHLLLFFAFRFFPG